MPSPIEIEAAARALAYKARREHASEESAQMYADAEWMRWAESARVALDAAESVRSNGQATPDE